MERVIRELRREAKDGPIGRKGQTQAKYRERLADAFLETVPGATSEQTAGPDGGRKKTGGAGELTSVWAFGHAQRDTPERCRKRYHRADPPDCPPYRRTGKGANRIRYR